MKKSGGIPDNCNSMNFEDHKIEILISTVVVIVFGVFIVNLLWSDTTPVYADSQLQYEEIISEAVNGPTQAEIRTAKVYYNEAVRLANLGRLKRALIYLKTSLENYPDFVPSHVKIQDMYLAMGKEDSIRTVYDDLKNIDPENPVYLYLHARLLDFEQSRREFEKIKEIDPEFYWSYVDLGYYHLNKGELDSAETEFRNAININPALLEGQIGLGSVFDNQGKRFLAIKQFNMALQINDKIAPEAYLQIGMIYDALRDTAKSLEYMRSFLEHMQAGPQYEFVRARVDSIEIKLRLKEIDVLPDTIGIR